MRTIRLEVSDDKAIRPSGNPFDITALDYSPTDTDSFIAKTGIKIFLEDDMKIDVVSLCSDVFILGWNIFETLDVYVFPVSRAAKIIMLHRYLGNPFARVTITENKIMPVRFVEFEREK